LSLISNQMLKAAIGISYCSFYVREVKVEQEICVQTRKYNGVLSCRVEERNFSQEKLHPVS